MARTRNSRRFEIGKLGDIVIGHFTVDHALDHPERVRRSEDQRGRRDKGKPEVGLEAGNNDHEFADEAGGARQSGIRHREQHHERGKRRHRVGDATVIGDLPAMHAVVQDANTEEHGTGDNAVRDHLHHAALHAQHRACRAVDRPQQEEAKRDEAHVRNR